MRRFVLGKDTSRLFPIGAKQSTSCGGQYLIEDMQTELKKGFTLVRLDKREVLHIQRAMFNFSALFYTREEETKLFHLLNLL